jgi:hypothetical protein
VKAERADRLAADLAPMLAQLRAEGAASLAALAAGLNARTVPAPRGGSWTATGVRRLLARAG